MKGVCSVEGCEVTAYKKCWCNKHYIRWRRYGDPLGGGAYAPKMSIEERFLSKIDKTGECWLWTGTINRGGYGEFRHKSKTICAHQYAYELFIGPIPEGLHIDHTCHTNDLSCNLGDRCLHRRCMNPDHFEAVTKKENTLRGRSPTAINAAKTHCPRGHRLGGDNVYPSVKGRSCKQCVKDKFAATYVKKIRVVKTHCPQGHEYAGKNLYISHRGTKVCKICRSQSQQRSLARKKELV